MNYKGVALVLGLAIGTLNTAKGQVAFSASGGFYQHTFELTLTANEGQSIHYTTDGSIPTVQSATYQQPLNLSENLYSTRDIYLMPDAPEAEWDPPAEVRHAIVLRAAAFDAEGNQVGAVATHTYLVTDLLQRQPTLPVVSVALNYEDLFAADSDIFSPNGFSPDNDFFTGNFNQHGREWERLASVEFYELDNSGFSQELGIRVHGGATRRKMQKPLKLYARKEYGNKKISCPIFDELPYTSFKRLVLKPFSAAWTPAGIQDLLASKIAQPLRFVSLASRPVTLYINGEYWGIYYLQEAPDERLVEQIDDVEADDVNIIGSWLGLVENGDNTRFNQLMDWLQSANLADTAQYQQICEMIDIDNFIDYQLFEAFIANDDWPANNMRCYQHDESLWRWIFYDGDGGFGDADRRMDEIITYQGDEQWPSCKEATLCLRRLLESPIFVEKFGMRLYELANNNFTYGQTSLHLERIQQDISAEIGWQSERYNYPTGKAQWKAAIGRVDDFLRLRTDIFVKQMEALLFSPTTSDKEFTIYPNPTHDYVNIKSSSQSAMWMKCAIYDIMGRPVLTQPIFVSPLHEVTIINLTALHAGIYTLKFSTHDTPLRLVVK